MGEGSQLVRDAAASGSAVGLAMVVFAGARVCVCVCNSGWGKACDVCEGCTAQKEKRFSGKGSHGPGASLGAEGKKSNDRTAQKSKKKNISSGRTIKW